MEAVYWTLLASRQAGQGLWGRHQRVNVFVHPPACPATDPTSLQSC